MTSTTVTRWPRRGQPASAPAGPHRSDLLGREDAARGRKPLDDRGSATALGAEAVDGLGEAGDLAGGGLGGDAAVLRSLVDQRDCRLEGFLGSLWVLRFHGGGNPLDVSTHGADVVLVAGAATLALPVPLL